ncbi:MAG TPA: LanC-like protein [Solirubrobacteraceae bacterium]|nr:LanC-like protein [Solirubrobacteraceae bacterium]
MEAAFGGDRLWPLHPDDYEPGMPADGVLRGLYDGAAGVLHAVWRLAEQGLYAPRIDGAAIAARLYEANLASPDEEGAGASLLAGSSGILLVMHRLAPSAATSELLADAIAANVRHPSNELLLGAPGTMLAARAMYDRTREDRFSQLWRESARTLLARQAPDGLWTQDMYGERLRYIGAAHGFAGNVRALFGAPEWLDAQDDLEARAMSTARAFAISEENLASWPSLDIGSRTGAPPRVQWCHGAPGMITSLAQLGVRDDEHSELLNAAGELAWKAGPCSRNAGLCHGTAGNGFAFLALFARTGEERWLSRARAFAMHAVAQTARLRAITGRGRYALFTGDLGAALLAAACLTGDPAFPGIDDL